MPTVPGMKHILLLRMKLYTTKDQFYYAFLCTINIP